MKTIGIKLADGSFYPVLEEDTPAEKVLELTTAHNNQTKIMVDLYRSKNCTMEDAEYVDSLQIESLNAHPNGEPTISFCVSIDEDNQLSARIKDPETGKESDTNITLVSRTLEERLVTDEYNISDSKDSEAEAAAVGAAVGAGAAVAGMGLLSLADKINAEDAEKEDKTTEDIQINDDLSTEENTEIDSAMIKEADSIDFGDSGFDLPENSDFLEEQEEIENPEQEEIHEEIQEELPEPEEDLAETIFAEDEPLELDETTNTEDEQLDFDMPAITEEEIPSEEEPEPELEPEKEQVNSDETMFSEEDIPVNFEDSIPEETESPISDETTVSDNETFDLPEDFDTTQPIDNITSDDKFFDKNTDAFGEPVEKDYSLPDFDDIEIPEENNEPELPDDFFNEDSFDNAPVDDFDMPSETTPTSAGGLSFTGLYDKETEMGISGKQDEDIKKKTKVPVIICVICAIICIIATLLVLFVIPSKYNLINKTEKQDVVITEKPEEKQNEVVELEPEPVPEAKEDEVVIIEKAEEVVPEQPEVVEEKLEDITYKIIWGDTLWDIADTYYKNPWRYKYIARYNGIKNPDHIVSGTFITIPAE